MNLFALCSKLEDLIDQRNIKYKHRNKGKNSAYYKLLLETARTLDVIIEQKFYDQGVRNLNERLHPCPLCREYMNLQVQLESYKKLLKEVAGL